MRNLRKVRQLCRSLGFQVPTEYRCDGCIRDHVLWLVLCCLPQTSVLKLLEISEMTGFFVF